MKIDRRTKNYSPIGEVISEKLMRLDREKGKGEWDKRKIQRIRKLRERGFSHNDAAGYIGGRIEMMLRRKNSSEHKSIR